MVKVVVESKNGNISRGIDLGNPLPTNEQIACIIMALEQIKLELLSNLKDDYRVDV